MVRWKNKEFFKIKFLKSKVSKYSKFCDVWEYQKKMLLYIKTLKNSLLNMGLNWAKQSVKITQSIFQKK